MKLNSKIGQPDIEQMATREGFGQGLLELGKINKNVVALTADLKDSTKVGEFAKAFPERFIECGVAEQNMMGVAAGLALSGKIPFATSYATFSPGRNWDQLRVSVCYSQANVKVIGCHTGVSVGPDGATHQALEDIALTRVLPNLTVVVPCDSIQAKQATLAIGNLVGPAYLRLTREKTPVIITEDTPFELGKAQIFREGTDVAIIGAGPVLYNAVVAAMELEKEGVSVCVVNLHTIKPIDTAAIIEVAKKCGAVVTLEEHQVMGGVGSAVAEVLVQNFPVPMEFVGMRDSFGESGEPEELIEKFGMGVGSIVGAVKQVIKRKS
jgi:transketolase